MPLGHRTLRLGKGITLGREVEVLRRNPARVVRRERDAERRPGEREVGVVIVPLGPQGHPDDERKGRRIV